MRLVRLLGPKLNRIQTLKSIVTCKYLILEFGKAIRMKLLWFSWKDITNPQAGGAEDVTHNILKSFASEGNDVLLITASYKGADDLSNIDGYRVARVGGKWTVYLKAWLLFRKKYRNWPDVVIEECNTIPFFTRLYSR